MILSFRLSYHCCYSNPFRSFRHNANPNIHYLHRNYYRTYLGPFEHNASHGIRLLNRGYHSIPFYVIKA